MRYNINHISLTENLPSCPTCGTITSFAKAADIAKDGRVYMIFRCPVDGTIRVARQQLCRVCGTKYVLGASSAALTVQPVHRPPEGGAAAA